MSKTRTTRHGTKDPAKGLFADSEMIDLVGIFGVLRRRKWSIAAITIAGTVAAYLYGSSVIPFYNAEATLLVEPSDSSVAELDPVNADLSADFNDIATQIRLLQSHNYQARVMEDLGLFDDPEFNGAIVDPDAPPKSALTKFMEQPLDTVLAWLPNEWLITSGTAQEPALESVAPYRTRERALNKFRDRVEFLSDPIRRRRRASPTGSPRSTSTTSSTTRSSPRTGRRPGSRIAWPSSRSSCARPRRRWASSARAISSARARA